ncbi:flagellar biosynthetic protein FliQ [Acidocella sp.]|uniref:flagellar biosynthetic protein FliQ n=1 Tax=Acidocella sp. TaxID=50710 RepID=UPI003D085531
MPLYLELFQHAFGVALAAIWPCVAVLLAVGLVTSILQAVLQIEDATFALLPKTMAMILLALGGGFGALSMFEALARDFIMRAPMLVHQTWY